MVTAAAARGAFPGRTEFVNRQSGVAAALYDVERRRTPKSFGRLGADRARWVGAAGTRRSAQMPRPAHPLCHDREAPAEFCELFTELSMNPRYQPSQVAETQRRMDTVKRLLSGRTMAMDEIILATGSSQPTLSRTIHELPDSVQFRVRGVRTPRYGLIRRLPGNIAGQQKVYRVTPQGSVLEAGLISPLSGGETFTQMANVGRRYDGLPRRWHSPPLQASWVAKPLTP